MAVTDGDIIKIVQDVVGPSLSVAQNVYWMRLDDPTPNSPSNSQIVSTVEGYLDDMYNEVLPRMSNAYEVADFTVERMEWDGEKWEVVENVGTGDTALTGGSTDDALPHGCAAVITARTERPQSRGRKFLTGIVEDWASDSTWVATVLTDLADFALEYLSSRGVVGASALEPIIASTGATTGGQIFDLLLAAVPAIVGYQRRRKPGVGS